MMTFIDGGQLRFFFFCFVSQGEVIFSAPDFDPGDFVLFFSAAC